MKKKIALKLFIIALIPISTGVACVQAAPGSRRIATFIGPVTLNNGNGPYTVGKPDSIVYTYSGSRAVYDRATTYELDTVSHTSSVTVYDFYTYTSTDSLLTDITQMVAGGVATNSTRLSRAYDAAGNDTLILNESWNAATSAWVNTYRAISSYNATKQATGLLQQSWNAATAGWSNLARTSFQYDAAGRDSASIQQKWMAATASWKNVTLNITRYTSFNKIATVAYQRWSDTTTAWKDSSRLLNNYNSSNYLVNAVSGPTYYGGRALYLDSLATLTLSAAGEPISRIAYQRDLTVTTNVYVPTYRYTNSYNAVSQMLSNQTEMISNTYVAYNSLTGFYQYNNAGQLILEEPVSPFATNGFLTKAQYRTYYETTTAVVHAPDLSGEITVYPSPATSLVILSLGNGWQGLIAGTLTDETGRIRYSWSEPATPNYSRQIPVADLPAGIYYFRLGNHGQTFCKTLLVQH